MRNKYKKSGHGIWYAKYHIVWVSKYRRKVLNPGVSSYITRILFQLIRSMPGVSLEQIGFDKDHVHFLVEIPPKYAISEVVAKLKSQSAKETRKKFIWLEKVYWKENILWSPGYFISTVGADENIIKRYVELQGIQDSDQQEVLL